MSAYESMLESKRRAVPPAGFEPPELHPDLFDFQRAIVKGLGTTRGQPDPSHGCRRTSTLGLGRRLGVRMPSRPWYKWYPGDFLADTRLLSLEEQGAYRALLDAIWMNGPIQDAPTFRRRLLNIHGHSERRLWTVLRPFFTIQNGRISHPRLDEQRAQLVEQQEKARKAGKKGGEANAKATRARARGGSNARARPDPDPDKRSTVSGFEDGNSRARARGNGTSGDPLTPEQREAAERAQAELEQRRVEAGVERQGPRPVASLVETVKPQTGGEE